MQNAGVGRAREKRRARITRTRQELGQRRKRLHYIYSGRIAAVPVVCAFLCSTDESAQAPAQRLERQDSGGSGGMGASVQH
jgi:hypothetical protein